MPKASPVKKQKLSSAIIFKSMWLKTPTKETFSLILGLLAILIIAAVVFNYRYLLLTKFQKPKSLPCNDCNVILISIDTLRHDRLSINGYSKKTSPNIDRFFKDGINFTNAYSQAPWTLPSHSSMLTGQYPKNNNVEIPTDLLPPQAETIAETLRQNGFETAAFTTSPFMDINLGLGQGFNYFKHHQDWQDTIAVAREAKNWLRENRRKKFFLFLHSFQVHDPYSPERKFTKKIDSDYQGKTNSFDIHDIVKLNTSKLTLDENELKRISSLYDGEVVQLDYYLGKIFAQIKNLGLDKKTVVILTSDHGEELGERGLYGVHGYSLYDELVHVPLLIKMPQTNLKKNPGLVELNDIYPTIMDILDINFQQAVDGQSLLKTSQGEINLARTVFSETSIEKNAMLAKIEDAYQNGQANTFRPTLREPSAVIKAKMVRQENFKLIQNLDGSFELYNLESDPKEKSNLINTEREVLGRLQNELLKISQSLE